MSDLLEQEKISSLTGRHRPYQPVPPIMPTELGEWRDTRNCSLYSRRFIQNLSDVDSLTSNFYYSASCPNQLNLIDFSIVSVPHLYQPTFRRITSFDDVDWLGERGLDTISRETLWNAINMTLGLYDFVRTACKPWIEPSVSTGGNGEIEIEWQRNHKLLTWYFQGNHAEFLKSWGPDMDLEMEDGDLVDQQIVYSTYEWLFK